MPFAYLGWVSNGAKVAKGQDWGTGGQVRSSTDLFLPLFLLIVLDFQ